ncbi:hypothetical protein BST61_g9389 [Cercospora zeina]
MVRRSRAQRRRFAARQRKKANLRHAGLMSLPSELRNRIWTLFFGGSIKDLCAVSYAACGMDADWSFQSSPPPLLLTCKQVYAEAVGIYYSTTTFSTKISPTRIGAERFTAWMEAIGFEKGSLIKDMRFFVSSAYDDLISVDCEAGRNEKIIISDSSDLLRVVGEAIASKYNGALRVSANLWYHEEEGGFEIWTSNPLETDREARRAYKQGKEAYEDWLLRKSSVVSRWHMHNPSPHDDLNMEPWQERLLDAFDKWYLEKYSKVATFWCGCTRDGVKCL